MPLQIRRGTTAQRLGITPLPSELIHDTTTNQLFVGNGSTPGGVNVSGGVSASEARTISANLLTTGVHSGITFTYNELLQRIDADVTVDNTGPFRGDLTGSVFSDDSQLLVDGTNGVLRGTHIGTLRGNVYADNNTLLVDATNGSIPWSVISGAPSVPSNTSDLVNDSGFITASQIPANVSAFVNDAGYISASGGLISADVNGSIFSDNSTLLVDATNGTIPWSVISGAPVIPTNTNQLINGAGYITSSAIPTNVSSFVNDAGYLTTIGGLISADLKGSVFAENSTVMVDATSSTLRADAIFGNNVDCYTLSSSALAITSSVPLVSKSYNNVESTNTDPSMILSRFFESGGIPVAVPSGTNLGTLSFRGFDGTSEALGAYIRATSGAAATTGSVPTTLNFVITENSGTQRTALRLASNGFTQVYQPLRLFTDVGLSQSQVIIQQNHSTVDSNKFNFYRGRGTQTAPASVVQGDDLQDIAFFGHDGTTYTLGASMSWITDGPISTGIMPTKWVMRLHDGTSSQVRITLEKNGDLLGTGSMLTSSTRGVGYTTGAGGTVTQLTDKSTAVTLDKATGEITTDSALLNSATSVSFTLNNSAIAATDHVLVSHISGGTLGAYGITATPGAGSAVITIRNLDSSNLSESLVIKFTVIKSVTA